MKQILILFLLMLCSANLLALEYNKKYSLETYVFLKEVDNVSPKSNLKQKYFLQYQNALEYTKVFVKINSSYSKEMLTAFGSKEILKTKSVALLSVPVESIPALATLNSIERIEVATQDKPLVDSALSQTHANWVQAGTGLRQQYAGSGVIVGSVDYGFDFTHPMFSDENGKCRITRAWIPLDESGTPPEFSEQGTLYTNPDYLKNTLKYSSRDNYHASHVLGIAAGSRVKTVNTKDYYSGIAPKAEMAVVECDGITINEALQYLLSYADSVQKPIVVNMSLGTIGGPCDGKSARDVQISEMLNTKPEGHILVVSAGNSGSSNLHINHQFDNENQSINVYQQFKPAEGNPDVNLAYFDVWGQPGDEFQVEVSMFEEENYPQLEPVITVNTATEEEFAGYMDFSYDCPPYVIQVEAYTGPKFYWNDKPYVRIMFSDASFLQAQLEMLPWMVQYKITSLNGTQSEIHCWNLLRYNRLWSDEVEADSYYSIGSPGTIPEVITVGAYVSKDTLRTLTHGNWPSSAGKLNEIANFSSKGPLTDGTIKPDITAPGSLLYSGYNNYDTIDTPRKLGNLVDYVEDAGTNNEHIIYWAHGTSMSSPVVAGIVALMLELNPRLNSDEIKDILRVKAINDEWTGPAKENKSIVWGWGKVNAFDIMKELEGNGIDEEPDFSFSVYPNPADGLINIQAENKTDMPYIINVYDNTGKLVYLSATTTAKQVDLSALPAGNYLIELYNHKAKAMQKLIKL